MSGIDSSGQLICTGGTPPPVNYTLALAVSKAGAGGGTVTSMPVGISCGSTCVASYTAGQLVTLTATSQADSTFVGWSGACSGAGTCTVTMNAAMSVTANFSLVTYPLNVATSGQGTVTSAPVGITCGLLGTTCSAAYPSGQVVVLTASTSGSMFAGWVGGGCSGTGTCTVVMTSAKTVIATFSP